MKKNYLFLAFFLLVSLNILFAQTRSQRLVLAEEFTQASCGPCAVQNPAFNALLDANPTKIVSIKYQTDWPGYDPMNLQNPSQVATRVAYYSVSGVPDASLDGGATDAPSAITQASINTEYALTSPFTIDMAHHLSPDYDSIYIDVTVTATASVSGTLKLHNVIIEREIHFATAPGSNGETDFFSVMRKMLPSDQGQALQSNFTTGQSQAFHYGIALPTYIYDKNQVAVVSFVQNNADKKVQQVAYSAPQPMVNDAALNSITGIPVFTCTTTLNPVCVLENSGTSTLTQATIEYKIDNATPSTYTWTGSLAPGATANVNIPTVTATAGSHTFNVTVVTANGSNDLNPGNSNITKSFAIGGISSPAPMTEQFTATTFPPVSWVLDNPDGGATWTRKTGAGATGGTTACAKMDFYNSNAGNIDILTMKALDFSSLLSASLTFYVAYAQYSSENDKLEVQVSTNCGTSWVTKYTKQGTTLSTAAATTSSFVPTSAQWRLETIDLNSYAGQTGVYIRFRATSAYGNNLYVDEINLLSHAPYFITNLSDQIACLNSSATFSVSAGGDPTLSYQWKKDGIDIIGETNSTFTINNVSLADIANYSCAVTNSFGTNISNNATLIIDTMPVVSLHPVDQSVCINSGITFSVSGTGGNLSYQWEKNGNHITGATDSIFNINITVFNDTANYTCVITNACGSVESNQAYLTINPLPIADAGLDKSICIGDSIILNANGGVQYLWDNNVQNGIPFSPSTTNTYQVTVTDNNNCSATDQVMVTVNTLPIANAGMDQTACGGQSVVLSASGGSIYEWDNSVQNGIAFNPTVTNTYHVTVIDGNDCVSYDSVVVVVSDSIPPNAFAGNDQEICSGESVIFNATGGVSYIWSNGVNNGDQFFPENTDIYTVTVTDENNCSSIDSVQISLFPLTIANAGSDFSTCYGDSVTLVASGGNLYSWDNNVQNGVPFLPSGTNTYNVSVTDNNNCTASDEVIVTVNSLPTANAGNDITACGGNNIVLTASGGIQYSWNNGVQNGIPFVPTNTNVYYVTVTDINDCSAVDSLIITVIDSLSLVANAGTDKEICIGESVTFIATGGINFTWNNGVQNGVAFTPTTSAVYTVTVTDEHNCFDTDSVEVIVNPLPVISTNGDQMICSGESITLTATGGVIYEWSGGVINGIPFVPSNDTTYTVLVKDENNCQNTGQVIVALFPLPSVPIINQSGNTLTSSSATENQWYFNNTEIVNATDQTYIADSIGAYQVEVTNAYGCTSISAVYNFTSVPSIYSGNAVIIFPNPTKKYLNVSVSSYKTPIFLELSDASSRIVLSKKITSAIDNVDLSIYSNGIYFLRLYSLDKLFKFEKIILTK